MEATITHNGFEFRFSNTDVVNPGDYSMLGTAPYGWKAWLLHDEGYTVAVVFADCEQDAIDEAVDAGKLDRWQVAPEELSDYGDTEEEQSQRLSYLGNAGEPFDIESLGMMEIPLPPFSFAGLVRAAANDIAFEEWTVDAAKTRRLEQALSYHDMMIDGARRALRENDPARAAACLDRAVQLRDEGIAAGKVEVPKAGEGVPAIA